MCWRIIAGCSRCARTSSGTSGSRGSNGRRARSAHQQGFAPHGQHGVLGADAAQVLRRLGFQVAGWSAHPKSIEGVACFAGREQLSAFLRRTNILVCLLPLTPQTRHILDRALFAQLDRTSPLGAPVLINAGRGGLQVERDILACLDDGTLGGATLDVFETEPLPPDSPLWSHPGLVVTPHNAADTDPDAIAAYVAAQIARFEAGEPLQNVVDPARGY